MEEFKKYIRTMLYIKKIYKAEKSFIIAHYHNDEEGMLNALIKHYKYSVKYMHYDNKKKAKRLLNDDDTMINYCCDKKLQLDSVINSYGDMY